MVRYWIGALIFSIAIVVAAMILGGTWRKTHETKEMIKVVGLAEKEFVSDLVVWDGAFTRRMMTVQESYAALKRDAEQIRQYLISKGVAEKAITFSAVNSDKEYRNVTNDKGVIIDRVFEGYRLRQSVNVESNDVDKMETVAREVTELLNMGLEFESYAPRYYYTKLAQLKLEMLAAASTDARKRAETIAKNAGGGLGTLRNAAMGVFQITAPYSDDESYSYGGSFNTSSKNKKASITARLEFGIE
jgi:hypothetical protein